MDVFLVKYGRVSSNKHNVRCHFQGFLGSGKPILLFGVIFSIHRWENKFVDGIYNFDNEAYIYNIFINNCKFVLLGNT